MINPPCHWVGVRGKFLLFLGSSAVERSAVNRLVAGSNPARGVDLRNQEHSEDVTRRLFFVYNSILTIFG